MKIQPMGNRVLIKLEDVETKTKGGLYIPDVAQQKTMQGKVFAIGTASDIEVKVGDVVLYDKYAGTATKIDNEEYIILRNDDVVAIIK